MLKRLLVAMMALGEAGILVGTAALGVIVLLPIFQIQQTFKGNPLWFWPGKDKSAR